MFPTPTPLPSGGPTPSFDISIVSDYINAEQLAIDAVGWWRVGMGYDDVWVTASGMLLAILVLMAFIAIMFHIASLGGD